MSTAKKVEKVTFDLMIFNILRKEKCTLYDVERVLYKHGSVAKPLCRKIGSIFGEKIL